MWIVEVEVSGGQIYLKLILPVWETYGKSSTKLVWNFYALVHIHGCHFPSPLHTYITYHASNRDMHMAAAFNRWNKFYFENSLCNHLPMLLFFNLLLYTHWATPFEFHPTPVEDLRARSQIPVVGVTGRAPGWPSALKLPGAAV